MTTIRLDHVTKVFRGGAVALDGVHLTIRDGELRIIAGIEDATSGSVEVDGAIIDSLPPKMRDVAMVFQNYALYPHMTVGENLGFALRLRHVPAEERNARVAEPDALTTPAPAGWPRFTATVVAAEFLGNAQHVLFAAPGGAATESADLWTARLDADRDVQPGARVTVGVDTSEVHLFDALSGTALARHPRRRVAEPGTAACVMVT